MTHIMRIDEMANGFSLKNRTENQDDELRNTFCGMDISDAKKKLGYWWTLDTQNVNSITRVGSYVFSRKGQGAIKFTTEDNIIVDAEDLGY